MILVTGGMYQGQYAFVKDKLHTELGSGPVTSGEKDTMADFKCAGLVMDYQQYVRRMLMEGCTLSELISQTEGLLLENPQVIIDIKETGSGIVPIELKEREYREACGRTAVFLAARAKAVYRVMAGLGVKIK